MNKIYLTLILILIGFGGFSQTDNFKLISAISYDKVEGYAYPDKTITVEHIGKSSIYYDSQYSIDQIEVGKTIWTFTPTTLTVNGETYEFYKYNDYFNVNVKTTKRIYEITVDKDNRLYVVPSEQYAWVNDQDIHRKTVLIFEYTTETQKKPLYNKEKTKKYFSDTVVGRGMKNLGNVLFLNLLNGL